MLAPEGFQYRPDFISENDEGSLVDAIGSMEFAEVRMRGVVAKRRTIHLGWLYGYESWRVTPGPPMPPVLEPLRASVAAAVGLDSPEELAEALISEYPPGAGIGWHRDAPMFGLVAAVSLVSACRLRFRRGDEKLEVLVEPRSLYLLSGSARQDWQHQIPPSKALRYSITFRTMRQGRESARTRLSGPAQPEPVP